MYTDALLIEAKTHRERRNNFLRAQRCYGTPPGFEPMNIDTWGNPPKTLPQLESEHCIRLALTPKPKVL